ncbi:hypothetical protein K0M31_002733 [Melipona bicolor]|uniref:Uncharacterized protein n=1 Tax=Melipona bicolor TaxID=60889 RepID=A0AA40KPS1_9HYME|nr:hypothetical protein K0M31_002733 [Melipona bicolor]
MEVMQKFEDDGRINNYASPLDRVKNTDGCETDLRTESKEILDCVVVETVS